MSDSPISSKENKKRPLSMVFDCSSKKKSFEDDSFLTGTKSTQKSNQPIQSEQTAKSCIDEDDCDEFIEEINDTTKRKSWIWEYFKLCNTTFKDAKGDKKTEKRVYCQKEKCKQHYKFSGSTECCINHLEKRHNLSKSDANETAENLPDANAHESEHLNRLLLMFIITAGI